MEILVRYLNPTVIMNQFENGKLITIELTVKVVDLNMEY